MSSTTTPGEPQALSPEEALLRDTARDFAQRELLPGAAERDEDERFDRSLFARMGALGFTAAPFPESVGGAGFSYRAWTMIMEEVARADMAMAVSLSVHVLSQYPVVTWGTAEQQARWLPAMLAGEALGAFALTEPHAGSDAVALRLRATPVGPADAPTAYRLDGAKSWITNAPDAERYLVFATLDPALGRDGITAFLVERGTPGVAFGRSRAEDGHPGQPGCRAPLRAAARSQPRTGSAGRGRAIASPSRRSGRGASRSPPPASGWRRPRWTPRRAT